jgi:iron complex transport system substrate-binding protein
MKVKKILALLLALVMIVSFIGCGASKSGDTKKPEKTEDKKIVFTDSVGRKVTVDSNITKIAVSGPLAQIVVFALAPDKLVGIAVQWDSSAEKFLKTDYYKLPVLGQLYGGKGEMNLEELLAAKPQVVIDIGEPKEGIVGDLDKLQEQTGIPFVHIDAYTDSMDKTYNMLGELLGMKDEAATLAKYCGDVYQQTLKIAGSVEKKKLLYIAGKSGLNVIAKDSYHAEVIDLLSDNLAVVNEPSAKGTGNEVDMEQILKWNPDVILFAPDSIYSTVGSNPDWKNVNAIKNGKYYEVPMGPYNWMGFPPSVQRLLGMMWMSKLLYPDAAKYDLYEEVSKYFKLFYHCDITEEQYKGLVANSIGK